MTYIYTQQPHIQAYNIAEFSFITSMASNVHDFNGKFFLCVQNGATGT